MTTGRSRQILSISMLFAAVLFGVVLAGGLDMTPPGAASPEAAAAPLQAPSGSLAGLPSFADLAEQVLPAVVSIDAQTIGTNDPRGRGRRGPQQNPFEFFFGPQQRDDGQEEPRIIR